ncbi:MAG: hypothetical protein IKH12_02985, partial [Clostridia bacterium]|nr:hypothetical protein [Clostridia bacterium]
MQVPSGAAKAISILLAILTPMLSLFFGVSEVAMTPGEKAAVVEAMDKADGFMTGICHPDPAYKQIKKANIHWIREDIPFPLDDNGKISLSYKAWKKEMLGYAKRGIKVMAITPYPEKFIDHGMDIRKDEDIPKIQKIARYLLKDLRNVAGAFQITNEMGVDRFTDPLTMEEAAKFIGVQAEAMYPIRGNILIGYNLGGLGIVELPPLMAKYNKYIDYVGIDLYFGCFENIVKSLETFPALMKYAYTLTRKPIILAEFGYIGLGEPKTPEQKQKILQKRYKVNSEAEARQDINAFIKHLPKDLRDEFRHLYKDKSDSEKADLLFKGEYANHIYRELSDGTGLDGYPHTPEGQAKFFADLIPMIKDLDFCIGAFIYMWNDSERCYVCGQKGCPVET